MRRALLSLVVFAGVLAAQIGPPPGGGPGGPGGPDGPRRDRGPRLEALQSALDISAEQAKELAKYVREQRRAAMEALKAEGVIEQLRTNHQTLKELLDSGNAEAAAVGAIVLDTQKLKEKMKASRDTVKQAVADYVTNTLGRGEELAKLQEAAGLQRAVGEARMLGLLEGGERRGRGHSGGAMGFRSRGPKPGGMGGMNGSN